MNESNHIWMESKGGEHVLRAALKDYRSDPNAGVETTLEVRSPIGERTIPVALYDLMCYLWRETKVATFLIEDKLLAANKTVTEEQQKGATPPV